MQKNEKHPQKKGIVDATITAAITALSQELQVTWWALKKSRSLAEGKMVYLRGQFFEVGFDTEDSIVKSSRPTSSLKNLL